ncbi:hypothetical protein K8I61_05300 [bacterium]|nr:hypothetical protein [bacterium]
MKRALVILGVVLLLAGAAAADDGGLVVKPSATIFAHYQYNLSAYEDYDARFDDNDMNSFELTRAYLGVDAKFGENWSARVTIDAARGEVFETETTMVPSGVLEDDPATPDVDETQTEVVTGMSASRTGAYDYFVKYAFLDYQPLTEIGTSFGMIKTPWADKIYSLWRHRYLLDAAFGQYRISRSSTADLGVSIHGGFGDDKKTYAYYNVAALNGEGVRAAEANAGKAFSGMLYLTPFQNVDALKGLALFGVYHFDKEAPDFPELTHSSFDAILGYRYDIDETMGFSVNANVAQRVTETGDENARPLVAGSDLTAVTTQVFSAWADFWFLTKFGVIARFDMIDPNTENDEDKAIGWQDESTFLLAGFWYQPVKFVRVCPNYRMTSYTAEITDDQGEQVTMQPDQFFFLNTEVNF